MAAAPPIRARMLMRAGVVCALVGGLAEIVWPDVLWLGLSGL